GGRDYTATGSVTASVAALGSGVEVTFVNHGGTPFYLTDFQVRGTAIIAYDDQQERRQDSTSIGVYGYQHWARTLPLYSTPEFVAEVAEYNLYQFKDARNRVTGLVFDSMTEVGATSLLSLDIGDVITLTHAQQDISAARYMISRIDLGVNEGTVTSIRFGVVEIENLTYWMLGDDTLSRLGVTTRLSL
ncbi:MAG: hypothetical protein WC657_06905, partial [Candidatus Paceibacterota bacterium]